MVYKDGAKMSKSKGNVVDPDDMIATYGADTARLFLLFAAPPELDLEWSDQGVEGSFRFLSRVWRLVVESVGHPGTASRESLQLMHRTVQRVGDDIERMHFNTAIAAMMEFLNHLQKLKPAERDPQLIRVLVQLIAPFAPHMAEELWEAMDEKGFVCQSLWPKVDPAFLTRDTACLVIQVNGKVRDKMDVAVSISEEEAKQLARSSAKIASYLADKQILKEIYVPGRLLNFVVKG
jgi:leucyl-tRNA synthetase